MRLNEKWFSRPKWINFRAQTLLMTLYKVQKITPARLYQKTIIKWIMFTARPHKSNTCYMRLIKCHRVLPTRRSRLLQVCFQYQRAKSNKKIILKPSLTNNLLIGWWLGWKLQIKLIKASIKLPLQITVKSHWKEPRKTRNVIKMITRSTEWIPHFPNLQVVVPRTVLIELHLANQKIKFFGLPTSMA